MVSQHEVAAVRAAIAGAKPLRALFTITLFVSSALLFLVEPMVAKMILPRFGGSPAVWSTSLLFFQVMLLLGYAYAHFSTRWLGSRRQTILHAIVVLAPLVVLPIAIPRWAASGEANPAPLVLGVLAVAVGLPFFALSAGAPVLQRWFASTDDRDAADPYFLYSASNLGSMIALLSYPLIIEPLLRLSRQSEWWTYGYATLLVMMLLCALMLWRTKSNEHPIEEGAALPLPPEPETAAAGERGGGPLYWIALSFVPSSLLMGVTNYLTSNIAPVPLLWVVPLALYLLTFILAFAKRPMAPVPFLARALPIIVTPLALVMVLEATEPLVVLVPLHTIAFVVAALMCHGLLAQSRPAPARLTEFYLWISVGGVLGGIFNALLAPVLFRTLVEYPIALVLACLLRPRLPKSADNRWDWIYPAAVAALTAALILGYRASGMAPSPARTALTMGLPAILCFLAVDRPLRFGLALGGFLLISTVLQSSSLGTVIDQERSFFGVHRIIETDGGKYRTLVHGTTFHGRQSTDPARRGEPLTYYYKTGPIGQVFTALQKEGKAPPIALVGLGVGSLAAYGQPGQRMTYFEIDPVVASIAQNPRYFTFLHDSKANMSVVLGDGRLTLAKEPDASFGLIVLDAFSSDAIPVHLLTREAIAMYMAKLQPGALLAFHLSNRYLELEPVLAKTAQSLGLATLYESDEPTNPELDLGKEASQWLIVARKDSDFGLLGHDGRWEPAPVRSGTAVWTDDYSNILSAMDPEKVLGGMHG